jgi:23S rRNA (adenine2503-C2)-methyltransferase
MAEGNYRWGGRTLTLRQRLLPKAAPIDPLELVELGEEYARATSYPIQYQWTLLEGVNDSDAEFDAVARLLAGKYAVLNLIPFNRSEGLDFRRPSWERAAELARHLHRRGILTKLRHSAGQEVEGGCGQLRARAEKPAQAGNSRSITLSRAPASPGVSTSANS